MLTIEQYGVKLTRLQIEEIELVRNWRNQDFVAQNMDYQKHITQKEQKKWFESINNANNYYFIIHFNNEKIGVINAKNYDEQKGFGEGGIFIGRKEYLETVAPTFSTLCLLNVVFLEMKLTQISRVKVLNKNHKSIEYNKLLGYKLLENTNDGVSSYYELTLENYIQYGSKLNQAAKSLSKNQDTLKISGMPSTINSQAINEYLIQQNSQ
jgi:UDP-4-amino-4,6-dideoxy-N-acetyl-beta-L-altrosamine N-acetyltransferase